MSAAGKLALCLLRGIHAEHGQFITKSMMFQVESCMRTFFFLHNILVKNDFYHTIYCGAEKLTQFHENGGKWLKSLL